MQSRSKTQLLYISIVCVTRIRPTADRLHHRRTPLMLTVPSIVGRYFCCCLSATARLVMTLIVVGVHVDDDDGHVVI